MSARLYRVLIPVDSIERAVEFYSPVLLQAGRRVSPGRHYFDCGAVILACYDAIADGDLEEFRPNPEHMYLAVSDLEAYAARLRAAGCSWIEDAIETRPWGERSIYARDPFGNPLCFVDEATIFTGE